LQPETSRLLLRELLRSTMVHLMHPPQHKTLRAWTETDVKGSICHYAIAMAQLTESPSNANHRHTDLRSPPGVRGPFSCKRCGKPGK